MNLTKWAVIHSAKDEGLADEFVYTLKKVTPFLGMKLAAPKIIKLPDNKPPTYLSALYNIPDMNPQPFMVVVPNNKGDHYATIKKKCYKEKSGCHCFGFIQAKGLMFVAT